LRHEDSKISENNGINNSAGEVDSDDEDVLDFSLRAEFISTDNKNHVVYTDDITAPHSTFWKVFACDIVIVRIAEKVTFGVIPEVIRRDPLDHSAVVSIWTGLGI